MDKKGNVMKTSTKRLSVDLDLEMRAQQANKRNEVTENMQGHKIM